MLHHTKGIVLHRFKYSDSKVITKVMTDKFGLQSYIAFGANSKKGRMQINLLQPLAILNMTVYHKDIVEMQKIKEISSEFPILSISSDIIKNSIAGFLSEFLLKTLKENEVDRELFAFIYDSIIILENGNENMNNFHLVFLWKLTQYLGIKPENNFSQTNRIFDLQAGKFITGNPSHKSFLSEKQSIRFYEILGKAMNESHMLNLSINERRFYLKNAIDFYNSHLDRPGEIKSLKILSEIFS